RHFAIQLYEDLPPGKSVVLAERREQLFLLQGEMSGRRESKVPLLLDTGGLGASQYQAFIAAKFPERWPSTLLTNRQVIIGPRKLRELLSAFAAKEPI